MSKSAVKNLGPTLSQMSGPSQTTTTNHSNLPASGGILINHPADKESAVHHLRHSSPGSPPRPGSSDGSTTVSATSSPGIDQQEEREHTLKMKMRIPELAYKVVEEMYNKQQQQQHLHHHQPSTSSNCSSKTHSTSSQHSTVGPTVGPAAASSSLSSATAATAQQFQKQHSTTSGSSNGGPPEDVSPRKKPRKQNMWVTNKFPVPTERI